jgi:hypothetical protein
VREAVLCPDRQGDLGQAYSFDGVNDGVDISTLPKLQTFTMAAWFRRPSGDLTHASIIGFDGMYKVAVNAEGHVACFTKAGSVTSGAWTGGPTSLVSMADGEWHHAAWSRGADGHQVLYIDGALENEGPFNAGVIPSANYGGYIGMERMWNGTERYFWTGEIDEVRIYDRVLSSNEVVGLVGVPSEGPTTAFLVADTNALTASESEFLSLVEEGGAVALVDVAAVKGGDVDLLQFDALCSFGYGTSGDITNTFDQEFCDLVYAAVDAGATLVVNRQAEGASLLIGGGYSGGISGNWSPAYTDTRFVTAVAEDEPLMAGVVPYAGDPNAHTIFYWHSVDSDSMLWRVDNSQSYVNFFQRGTFFEEPDGYLTEGFTSSTRIYGGEHTPFFYRGRGRVVILVTIHWTFDQSTGDGGTVGPAGQQILANIATLPRFDRVVPSLDAGLIAHYTFDADDGDWLADDSGNGLTGAVHGATWTAAGVDGGAFLFDGSNDYVDCGNVLNFDTNDYAIAVWVRTAATSDSIVGRTVLAKTYTVGSADRGYVLVQQQDDFIQYAHLDGVPYSPFLLHESPVNDGQWHHIAVSWDASDYLNRRLYIDGALEVSGSTETNTGQDNDHHFMIGARTPTVSFWDGALDDLRIYDRTLSSNEVAELYAVDVPTNLVSLVIEGEPDEYGAPGPQDYGTNTYAAGTVVTNTAVVVVPPGLGTRPVCLGWTGAGSVPASGESNEVVFTIAEDSELTWQWGIEHWLDVGVQGSGVVDVASAWVSDGTEVVLQGLAYPGWMFQEWTGDVVRAGIRVPITAVMMDRPRDVTAVFCADADDDGMPDWWEGLHFQTAARDGSGDWDHDRLSDRDEWDRGCNPNERDSDGDGVRDGREVRRYGTDPANPDSDGDGVSDGDEVRAGTDPLGADSQFAVRPPFGRGRGGEPVICWASQSNRWYSVLRATSLLDGFEEIAGCLPATPPLNVYTDTTAAATGPRFYRIGLEELPVVADFDGDRATDPALFLGTDGHLAWLTSTGSVETLPYGYHKWLPAVADYDGDLKADFAWFAPGNGDWRIYLSGSGYARVTPHPELGGALSIPVAADFDGDGLADPAVLSAASGEIKYVSMTNPTVVVTSPRGFVNWLPAVADYDGDRKADYAWFSPVTGMWRIYLSGSGYAERLPRATFGDVDATPLPADYDGDGLADLAFMRPVTGRIRFMESGSGLIGTTAVGHPGWFPAVGDFDGNGQADCAWYKSWVGKFHVVYSDSNNIYRADNVAEELDIGGTREDRPAVGR